MILLSSRMFIITRPLRCETLFDKCIVCHITKSENAYDVNFVVHFNLSWACNASNFLFTKVLFSELNLKTRDGFEIFALIVLIFIHLFESRLIILNMMHQISNVFFVITSIFFVVDSFS